MHNWENPALDWDDYCAMMDREPQYPVCSNCYNTIESDYYYRINGEVICESCLNNLYREATEDFQRED